MYLYKKRQVFLFYKISLTPYCHCSGHVTLTLPGKFVKKWEKPGNWNRVAVFNIFNCFFLSEMDSMCPPQCVCVQHKDKVNQQCLVSTHQ